ncbi:unnamed protein product [Adineta ricciae]|uniref:ETS domain-containing protein n=1 Tax=Adineta ricciae TaxID=249248 RepID=A0A813X614_ADIRI|nr:unnamed protein product [Adineta ricciae]CAF0865129.1 unnamed protein product [Adineta ricciae]
MASNNDDLMELNILDDCLWSEGWEPDLIKDLAEEGIEFSTLLEMVHNPPRIPANALPVDPKTWTVTDPVTGRRRPPRLFEFLLLLLKNPDYQSFISFKDLSKGVFEIHEPEEVAYLWQQIKNRQATQDMTYDKLARAVRWYYKKGLMVKTNTKYTFQFSRELLQDIVADQPDDIARMNQS